MAVPKEITQPAGASASKKSGTNTSTDELLKNIGTFRDPTQQQLLIASGERVLDTCFFRLPVKRADAKLAADIIDMQGGPSELARAMAIYRRSCTEFDKA